MSDDPNAAATAEEAAEAAPEEAAQSAEPPAEQASAADPVEAAREAILAEARGEKPPEQPAETAGTTETPAEPEEEAASEQEAAAETEAAEVDWAAMPEPARAAFEAERLARERAEQSFKSREGREAALQRRLDALIAGDGTDGGERPATGPKPEDANASNVAALSEELQQFAKDYPEIATPVGKALRHMEGQINALRSENDQLRAGFQSHSEERQLAHFDAQERAVMEEHPDFGDIAGSDSFKAWVGGQPAYIQKAVEENSEMLVDATTVNDLLTRYKTDSGIGVNGGRNGSNGTGNGATRQPADPIRSIQRRSGTGLPRPSAGARAPERAARGETVEEARAAMEAEERKRWEAADARA